LVPEDQPELPPDVAEPRTRLARWLTDAGHPLTARVIVNRLWQGHFAAGLVRTANDFGTKGDRPSHPELLDWLAATLVDGGWRLKPIHRMIVLSAAYRQSSRTDRAAGAAQGDPENRWLWHVRRRRLEAEEIRDAMLAVCGRLNHKVGGPSVMVRVDRELVDLLYKPSQWKVASNGTEHDRRSIYLMSKRNLRLPFFDVFDAPTTLAFRHPSMPARLCRASENPRQSRVRFLENRGPRRYALGTKLLVWRLTASIRYEDLRAAAHVRAVPSRPRQRHRAAVLRVVARQQATGGLLLRLLRAATVRLWRQVQLGHRLAELLPPGRRRERRHGSRPKPRHGPYRLGCGRGAVLLLAAQHLTTGRAVGVDLWRRVDQSGNSPEATRRNALAEGVADRVELHTADMTALPFEDNSIDVVVSSFGDPQHQRTCRPGKSRRRGGSGAASGR
jgi:hypothetical protein